MSLSLGNVRKMIWKRRIFKIQPSLLKIFAHIHHTTTLMEQFRHCNSDAFWPFNEFHFASILSENHKGYLQDPFSGVDGNFLSNTHLQRQIKHIMTGYVCGESECIEKINLDLKADELNKGTQGRCRAAIRARKLKISRILIKQDSLINEKHATCSLGNCIPPHTFSWW